MFPWLHQLPGSTDDEVVPAASSVAVTPGHTGDITTAIRKTCSEFTSAESIPPFLYH